jgi:predicted NBD/HSP70 family sugar kinase
MQNTSKGTIIDLLLQHGSMSRADIARETGLSRAAITLSMGELLDDGIVLEVGTSASTGGRRPIMVRLGGERCLTIGIALEDDLCLATALTLDGETIDSNATPLPYGSTPDAALFAIGEEVERLRATFPEARFIGCGLALAAFVDPETDSVTSTGFGWRSVRLREQLEHRIGLPAFILDNVQAAALGELWLRGRESRQSLAYIYAGRGAGGSIVIDRQIYFGRLNLAGSVGSMLVSDNGTIDEPFGGRFEDLTEPSYLISWLNSHRDQHPQSELPLLIPERSFLRIIAGAAIQGDSLALATMERAAQVVGAACTNLINIINANEIILGGPIGLWGDQFVAMVSTVAARWSLPAALIGTEIRIAQSRHVTIPLGAGATIIQRASELLTRRASDVR